MASLKRKLEVFDRQSDNFAKASKQPWECSSYAEFLASLPEEEQPVNVDCDEEE